MITHNFDPVVFSIGPLDVYWYSLAYIAGVFFVIYWLRYLAKRDVVDYTKKQIEDYAFFLISGVVIGARLFMFVWEPAYYFSNPLEIFMIWKGGMSFHGGLVGIVVANYLWCRKHKWDMWRMADYAAAPIMASLALGRIANFINGELLGRATSVPWCVVYNGVEGCRHPSTLYAAGKRFIITGWLFWLNVRSIVHAWTPGFIFWNFVFWDGVTRLILDVFREDVLYYGLSKGQWMCVVMVIVSVYMFARYYKDDWKRLLKR